MFLCYCILRYYIEINAKCNIAKCNNKITLCIYSWNTIRVATMTCLIISWNKNNVHNSAFFKLKHTCMGALNVPQGSVVDPLLFFLVLPLMWPKKKTLSWILSCLLIITYDWCFGEELTLRWHVSLNIVYLAILGTLKIHFKCKIINQICQEIPLYHWILFSLTNE